MPFPTTLDRIYHLISWWRRLFTRLPEWGMFHLFRGAGRLTFILSFDQSSCDFLFDH